MIFYHEALNRIRKVAHAKQHSFLKLTETLSIEPNDVQLVMGRILAEDMISKEAIPPFHNSSMDGFAVHSEVTLAASEQNPISISVKGIVYAGQVFEGTVSGEAVSLDHFSAIEIMTGAPMPAGFDAVVKIEDVEVIRDVTRDVSGKAQTIKITAPLEPGEHVRKKGTDFSPGQKLLSTGAALSAEHILGFATVGLGQVKVFKRPKIALISTGNELVDHIADSLHGGMIRNATAPYLMSAIPLFGAEAKYYGTVKDDTDSFKKLLSEILTENLRDQPDIILTTGAVSKGKLDFVPGALKELGAEILFHGVAIRPGRPLLFGQFANGPVVFAVPGNPISTAVALRFFISPYLRTLQGLHDELESTVVLSETTEKAKGLRCFWKTSMHSHHAKSLSGQESYRVSTLLPANAWMILPEEDESIAAGSIVQTLPLYPSVQFTDLETEDGGCC